jgi:DNA modification methylase
MLRPLSVIDRRLSELKPDPGNPRTHPKAQIEQIAASIKAFGFVNPVLIDEAGGVIAGHGRLLAARKLGLETVPTIEVAGLTAAQKRGLRIADNRIAQNSGWDHDLLRLELHALTVPEITFNVEVLGFSSAEIDIALGTDAGEADDEVPEPTPTPRTRPGDIWILGPHRIGCGDARDQAFVRKVMGEGIVADLAFLDPPYNVPIVGYANTKAKHKDFAMASGEMSEAEYRAFLEASLAAATAVSREGAVHFLSTDWRQFGLMHAVVSDVYSALINLCVWVKSNAGMGSLYRSAHELILVARVGSARHFNAIQLGRHGRHRTNVWDYASVTSPKGGRRDDLELHPTTKPVALVADAILDVSKRGAVVLDLFLGSGTTLIAAERTGRVCRGVELDPAYVDVAVERWEAQTGRQAQRARSARRSRP